MEARAARRAMTVIRSVNPATLASVGEVRGSTAADVRAAVKRARAAQPAWAARSVPDRARVVRAFGKLVHGSRENLAALVTAEVGKPFPEALLADVLPVLDAVEFLTRDGPGVLADTEKRLTRPLLAIDRTSRIMREPVGVIGVISPWNYPFAIPAIQILYAVFAGNAVVLKPSELSTQVALRVVALLHEAGVPEDVVIACPGRGEVAGDALAKEPLDGVVFTGSVATGRRVESAAASHGARVVLELGGSDPAIVLEDADLDLAANGIVWGRFANAGQTCAAVKRVVVVASVAHALTEKIVEKTRLLRVGDGASSGVDVGPLIRVEAVGEMEAFVADAVKAGGRVLVGGTRAPDLAGHFFLPTVIADASRDMRLMREECFGPVLPILVVADADEAVAAANASPFGLSASIWTGDTKRGEALARRVEAGTVTINDCVYTFAVNVTPWCGVKASGTGTTHGPWGLLEMTRLKHVNVAPAKRPWANLWWFPYRDEEARVASQGLDFLYGGVGAKAKRGVGMARQLFRKRNL